MTLIKTTPLILVSINFRGPFHTKIVLTLRRAVYTFSGSLGTFENIEFGYITSAAVDIINIGASGIRIHI